MMHNNFQCTTVGFWESLATPVKVYNGGDTGYLDDAYLDERYLDNVHLDDGHVNDGYLDDGYLDNGHLDSVQNSSGYLYSGQYDQPLRLAGLRCFHQKYQKVCKKEYLQLCVDKNTKNATKKNNLTFCLSPTDWADVYYTVYNCEIFVFPLAIIIATHLKIYMLLKRWMFLFSTSIILFELSMMWHYIALKLFFHLSLLPVAICHPPQDMYAFEKVAVTLTPEDEKRSYQSLASRSSEKLDGVCVHVLMG